MTGEETHLPAGTTPRRAFYFTGGFLTQPRIRRILELSGHQLKLGKPGPEDDVLVWGHSPYAKRGEAVAKQTGAHVVRVEDAFLRSLFPGREGEAPLGLTIDRQGCYFDASHPSELETLLATHALDNHALLDRARVAITRLREGHLTKYSAVDPDIAPPDPGYVLVIDQTRGDASIRLGGASDATFREMLVFVQEENPGARIVIKTHPESAAGHRAGHYGEGDCNSRISLFDQPISPWVLMEGAVAVYTVSSQLGFEAILAGHRPQVFGQPFYAGWGLSEDRNPIPRRKRKLTRAQLVAGALLLYPHWYDPYHDRLCGLEDVLACLEAQSRAWREDRKGYTALGMRAWKRAPMQKVFGGSGKALRFVDGAEAALAADRPIMVWASKVDRKLRAGCEAAGRALIRVEDGFLRSRGLGAELIPPLSLVADDLGIYYDPHHESRLEQLIAEAADYPPTRLLRAENLIKALTETGLSKYNLGQSADLPDPGTRKVVLVPGQVEDDASIRLGAGQIASNLDLLRQARILHPDAFLIYKPHPDIEAGLREGAVPAEALGDLADHVAFQADPVGLIERADEVVTMTSLLGFEALLRGVPVTVTGAPFYAGWGLTKDLGRIPDRRKARPSLAALAHATLISYPRYFDPLTDLACPAEVVVARLAAGQIPKPALRLRWLAKLQGWFAGHAWLWR